jgi:hypothetical protein
VILLAKTETRRIQGQPALVTSVGQSASPREHDFASSRHEEASPPQMKMGPGYL